MITIYHNPRCRKSRAGIQFLQAKNIQFEVVDYTKNPFDRESLAKLLQKLNKKPFEIVRQQEEEFKEKLKGKNFNDAEWIEILVTNQKLIQRPIVVKDYKAVVGIPAEEIDLLFEK